MVDSKVSIVSGLVTGNLKGLLKNAIGYDF